MSELRTVGRVKDAHGLKGELWVVLFAGEADWLESLRADGTFGLSRSESAESEVGSAPTMYRLKGAKPHKNGLILQSPDIVDRTQAESMRGQFLTIPARYLVGEEEYFLSEIEGFAVHVRSGDEEEFAPLGPITGFSHNGAQDLLLVAASDGEVMIPFVDDFVDVVRAGDRAVFMTLPKGLIDVQLGREVDADEAAERAQALSDDAEAEDDDIFGDK